MADKREITPGAEEPSKKYDQDFFLDLAAKGKEAWNAWRRDPANKDVRVTFTGIDFSEAPKDRIDFSGFEFLDYADFSGCKWRGVDLRLDPESFRPGRACFTGADFGGHPNFDAAVFGGYATFARGAFGALASFTGAAFGRGANFTDTTFGKEPDFTFATFNGAATFTGAIFGISANFTNAAFGYWAKFTGVTFADRAIFTGAAFGEGGISRNARPSAAVGAQRLHPLDRRHGGLLGACRLWPQLHPASRVARLERVALSLWLCLDPRASHGEGARRGQI
jgi:uncharacterized protein YjbI with pentapeptide repeats